MIRLKVVQLKPSRIIITRSGKKTSMRQGVIKDGYGTKNRISFWGTFMDAVTEGGIYEFLKLQTDGYPKEKPHQLSSQYVTRIVDVTSRYEEIFRDITLNDGTASGTITGVSEANVYLSCPFCMVKMKEDSMVCHVCKKDVATDDRFDDFCAKIMLETPEEFESFVIFRRGFSKMPFYNNINTAEDIEEYINIELVGKSAKFHYCTKDGDLSNDKCINEIELI
jgi:hypothetical protein